MPVPTSLEEKRKVIAARSAELAQIRERLLIKDPDPEGFGGEEFLDGEPMRPVNALKKQLRTNLIAWLTQQWSEHVSTGAEFSAHDREWLSREQVASQNLSEGLPKAEKLAKERTERMKPYLDAKANYRMAKYDLMREAALTIDDGKRLENAAVEMATIREASGVVDPDPDCLSSKLS